MLRGRREPLVARYGSWRRIKSNTCTELIRYGRGSCALDHKSLPEYDWLKDLLHSGKSGTIFPSRA